MWVALLGAPLCAQSLPFELGGQTIQLEKAPATAGVFLRAFRPNRATGRWEVDVVVTNGSDRVLQGPVVLRFDVATGIAPGISGTRPDAAGQPFIDLTSLLPDGGLRPGTALRSFTLSMGDGRTRPVLSPGLYSRVKSTEPGLVVLRTLAADGVPVDGVEIEEIGPATPKVVRSGRGGWVSMVASPGVAGWRVRRAGHVPVIRLVPAGLGGRLSELESARLTPLAASGPTRFAGATLPAPLPRGWTPLAAGWFGSGPGVLELGEPLAAGSSASLVQWEEPALRWRVLRVLAADGAGQVPVEAGAGGLFAVVRPDPAPTAPPPSPVGEVLAGVPVVTGVAGLTATGRVNPASRAASVEPGKVTAEGVVEFVSTAGPLASGMAVPAEVVEEYRMRDGTRRVVPAYGVSLTAFREGIAGGLTARFPLRPYQLLSGEELAEAVIRVRVHSPGEFSGARIPAEGGEVGQGGLSVRMAPGDLGGSGVAALRRLDAAGFTGALPAGLEPMLGFELGVGEVVAGRRLTLEAGTLPAGREWVLARVIFDGGRHGFQPVERMATDAAGALRTVEPAQGERLGGMDGGGQYWLFRMPSAQGLVTGVVNGPGGAATGASVRLGPWTAFADAEGRYRLVAPAGEATVSVRVGGSGDGGLAMVTVPGAGGVVVANVTAAPRGPRVVLVTPTNNAVSVAQVTAVSVTFDRPVQPGTLALDGVRLLDATGRAVTASLTLGLSGTTVTLLPSAPLEGNVRHTVAVAAGVTGLNGLAVEGPREFAFTTESALLLRTAGEVTSREPTNGAASMSGSPGTADPEAPVILVNETTGHTSTVLSKADGSFSNSIPASVDDFLAAVLVNRDASTNRIPVSKQFFRDGSVALFNGGGILEATSEGGPVEVIVEPGAIEQKTKLKLTPIPFEMLTNQLGTLPREGRLLGGLMLTQEGDDMKVGADLSFPVDVATLGLTNAPEKCTWALVTPREVDGVVVYEVVDRMHYEDGRLVTHSPPFRGALLKELQKRFKQSAKFDKLNRKISKALGLPDLKTTFYHVALLPLLMSQGHSLIVVGETYSAEFDDTNREITGTRRLLTGASVAFAYHDFQDLPGRLQPGSTFTVSGSDGKYSILFPINRLQENGFLVRGTHPAFPFQRAVVPVTIPSLAQQFNSVAGGVLGPNPGLGDAIGAINNALNQISPKVAAHLAFPRLQGEDPTLPDGGPPVLALSVTPREPAPGTNSNDGATIVVSAIDETAIAQVTLEVIGEEPLSPDVTNAFVRLNPVSGARTTVGRGSIQDAWRLTSQFRASVLLQAKGVDSAGHETVAMTTVQLIGDRQLPPRGTNDTLGPRVLATFPLANATGVRPGTPVLIQLSEPVAATNLASVSAWLTVYGGAELGSVALSGDGRQLTVFLTPSPTDPSAEVSITLAGQLADLAGNPFDQDPATAGDQSFTLAFQILTGESKDLTGMASGGGVVQKGAFAYALERTGAFNGSVVVYNLQSNTPAKIGELRVPGFPRDVAMIPSYAFKLRPSDTRARTNDLLAVVGGVTGSESLQYLWILDVTDPANPVRLAGANISFGVTATTKIVWSPPFLAYLDSAADVTSVALVDLQTFLIGKFATDAEIAAFPVDGQPGVDENGDGDYVDVDDELPLPERNPVSFFGKMLSLVDAEGDRRIEDFDIESDRGLVGIVMRGGSAFGGNGLPDPSRPLPPAYRTVFAGMQAVAPTNATLALEAGSLPRRVAMLPQVRLEPATNQVFRDLAVVSVAWNGGASNGLVVIDITNPAKPERIGGIDLTEYGDPQSLRRREDGLLAVATRSDVLLLEPARLRLGAMAGGAHPAIVGIIPGAGSGVRSYVAAPGGFNLVSAGGSHRVTYTAPLIRFLVVPQDGPFTPEALTNLPPARIESFLGAAQYPAQLQKARLFDAPVGTNPPALASLDPRSMYYIRVDALGTVGVTNGAIDLVLESLNNAGRPLPNPNAAGLPVRLAPTNTLVAIGDTNWMSTNASPYRRTLRATRLATSPTSPLYNVFLAGPVALTDVPLTSNQVNEVQQQFPRGIVRAGRFLWAGLDGTNKPAAYPTGILSRTVARRIQPGTMAVAGVNHIPRPVLFIPGIAGSYLDETNSTAPVGGAVANVTNERWVGFGLDSNHRLLSLTNASNTNIAATDVIRHVIRQAEFVGVYAPILSYLTNELGFVEYDYRQGPFKDWPRQRTVDGALQGQLAKQPDLFVYPYDWRRDNATSASNLLEYLKLVKMFQPEAEKVDIIAHSMGGLVARRFILDNPGKVEKCITIATPWLGAPKAIAALQTGDFDSLAMSLLVKPETLQGLAEDFAGLHQLLPSRAYFDLGGTPLGEGNWDLDGSGTTDARLSYDQYKSAIDVVLGTRSGSRPVATTEQFHSRTTSLGAMDDWRGDSTGVEHSVIYGVQKVPRTIGMIRTAMRLRPVEVPCNDLGLDMPWKPTTEKDIVYYAAEDLFEGHERFALERRFEYVRVEGDGTVPTLSASRRGTGADLAPSARLYPVISSSADRDGDVEHNGLLGNTNVLQLVRDILNDVAEPALPPAATPPPFVLVNLSGHDPESVKVTDATGSSPEPVNVPDGGTGMGVQGEIKRLIARFVAWATEDRSGRQTVQLQLVNAGGSGGSHTVKFDAKDDAPMLVSALYFTNGVPTSIHRWRRVEGTLAPAELVVDWSAATTNRVVLKVGSSLSNLPPSVVATGAAAADETAPRMRVSLTEVDDGRLDYDDGAFLQVEPSDDVTPANQIRLFLAFDRLEDSDAFNDLYRPVAPGAWTTVTNTTGGPGGQTTIQYRLKVPDLQMQPVFLVGDDAAGNPGFLAVPRAPSEANDDTLCDRIEKEKAALREAIDAAVQAVNTSAWKVPTNPAKPGITKTTIQYILEQGSGACVWMQNPCVRCKGIFTPDSSDHDYEVFLPVFSAYSTVPAGFAQAPYARANVDGDWFFRPPVQEGNQWVYRLPGVLTNFAPVIPGKKPKTPANFITEIMSTVASNRLAGAGYTFVAENISFFTARDEHFREGLIDLELPLESGADPIGDAGTGRQMLMLKWILEGAYVPGYEGPDLDAVFEKLRGRTIQSVEGYEWAVYQEFAAMSANPLLRTSEITGSARPEAPAHDFLYDVRKSQVKKLGKATIRATLGLMVDAGLTDLYLVDRGTFNNSLKYRGYEEFIAGQAAKVPDPSIFLPATPADIQQFYLAKVADKAFLKDILKPEKADELDDFVALGIRYLRAAQARTKPAYDQAMLDLSRFNPDEYLSRSNNLAKVWNGFPNLSRPGLTDLRTSQSLNLTLRVINDGPKNAGSVELVGTAGGQSKTMTFGLAGDRWMEVEGKAAKSTGYYLVEPVAGGGGAKEFSAYVKQQGSSKDPYATNNWFGFRYYILDVNNPARPALPAVQKPGGAPDDEEECRVELKFR